MSDVTATHEEKETLTIDVNLPGHDARVTTPLFTRTRHALIAREGDRCFVCGRTPAESGHPNEAHHVWIERCLAEGVDWSYFREKVFALESMITGAADYCRANPMIDDIMSFVDDQTVNGLLLCKEHHTSDGKDIPCGIHTMPFPLWFFQAYGKDGFQFTKTEIIEHEVVTEVTVPA